MAPFGFLLIIFIIHSCVGQDDASWEEEIKANNLVAKEDIIQSIQPFAPSWRSFGDNWVIMSDGDGYARFSAVDNKTAAEGGKTVTFGGMDDKITFYIYTRENPDGVAFRLKTLRNITIDPNLPTAIICHGWMADSTSSVTQNIKDAFLARGGFNVIAVDWGYYSRDFLYVLAVNSVKHVGEHVGRMIDELVTYKNVSYDDVHAVGHSLGAHVSGCAGGSTKAKIGRITGLDPALPGFRYITSRSGKLDDTDAKFVDVIHTCAGFLGLDEPVGHIDFYPNGGSTSQPGCKSNGFPPAATEACSHSRSHQFFSESVAPESKFIGIKCADWDLFKESQCENVYETMGLYVSKKFTGIFYLKTNEESPFAMGTDGTIY